MVYVMHVRTLEIGVVGRRRDSPVFMPSCRVSTSFYREIVVVKYRGCRGWVRGHVGQLIVSKAAATTTVLTTFEIGVVERREDPESRTSGISRVFRPFQ